MEMDQVSPNARQNFNKSATNALGRRRDLVKTQSIKVWLPSEQKLEAMQLLKDEHFDTET